MFFKKILAVNTAYVWGVAVPISVVNMINGERIRRYSIENNIPYDSECNFFCRMRKSFFEGQVKSIRTLFLWPTLPLLYGFDPKYGKYFKDDVLFHIFIPTLSLTFIEEYAVIKNKDLCDRLIFIKRPHDFK